MIVLKSQDFISERMKVMPITNDELDKVIVKDNTFEIGNPSEYIENWFHNSNFYAGLNPNILDNSNSKSNGMEKTFKTTIKQSAHTIYVENPLHEWSMTMMDLDNLYNKTDYSIKFENNDVIEIRSEDEAMRDQTNDFKNFHKAISYVNILSKIQFYNIFFKRSEKNENILSLISKQCFIEEIRFIDCVFMEDSIIDHAEIISNSINKDIKLTSPNIRMRKKLEQYKW